MSFEKYENRVIALERDREYAQTGRPDTKPKGLWFSVPSEDDWPHWCESEGFRTDWLQHRHAVAIDSTANLCILTNKEQIDLFHEKYAALLLESLQDYELIDWQKVSETYDGIVISPYVWERRNSWPEDSKAHNWYYGWDVSSGVIWNLDKVKDVFIPVDVDSELATIESWVNYNATVRAENVVNMMRYGVMDPNGGGGRLPLSLKQYNNPWFDRWTKR